MPLMADEIIIDEDHPSAWPALPASTEWETRPGRQAFLFKCQDKKETLEKEGLKEDIARIKFFDIPSALTVTLQFISGR